MATLYPPPSKRQKLAQAEKAREQQEIESIPSDLGSVRVQFYDQATGQPTGPAVSVPVADANVKNLETLLNTLQGNVRSSISTAAGIHFDSDYRKMMSEYHTASPTTPKKKNKRSTFFAMYTTPSCSPESRLPKTRYPCSIRPRPSSE
jgi:hypothetical protein